jgi:hypothetical protein
MVYNHEEENARFMIQLRKMALTVEPVGETTLCAQTTITPGGDAVNGARCHVGLSPGATQPLMVDFTPALQTGRGSTRPVVPEGAEGSRAAPRPWR